MNNLLRAFSDKRLRYGTFSTVMIIVAIGMFMLVNMVADQLNISYDLTRERIFSLSPGSITIAQGLEADVTIYSLWPTGQENFMFQQLLEEYAAHSNRITVINRDPVLHPAFVEQFALPEEPIAHGSIIVVGPERHRVIHAAELVSTQFNWQTFQSVVTGFNVEPRVSNAINFVVAADSPIIYHVVGNDELQLPPNLIEEIEMSGYTLREVNLMFEPVPEDADMLFITMPGRDWTPEVAETILEYLQDEGRAIFVLGYRPVRFERMDEVLAAYGVRLGDYMVIESNPNHFFMNNHIWLLPDLLPNPITDPVIERNFMPVIAQSTGIDLLEMRRPSVTIEPFMRTSNQSYGRIDPSIATVTRVPGDADGPFDLAVTVEDMFFMATIGQTLTTRMVVFGSEFIMSEELNTSIGGTNWRVLVNSIDWLRGAPAQVWIPSQAPIHSAPLQMTQAQAGMIALFSVILLPLAFAATGLVIWLRRRNA